MDSQDASLRVVAGCVLIWLALAGATVELLAGLVAFGSAHLLLRDVR